MLGDAVGQLGRALTVSDICLCVGEGQPVTLVCTDVEGSTELWEWDTHTMVEAFALHDRLLRSQLGQFYGYEVSARVIPKQPYVSLAIRFVRGELMLAPLLLMK